MVCNVCDMGCTLLGHVEEDAGHELLGAFTWLSKVLRTRTTVGGPNILGGSFTSCAPEKTSRSITYPKIALGQARLTQRFFRDRLPKKKMNLVGMNTLLFLLSLSHDPSGQDTTIHPLRRLSSSSVNPKQGTFPLGHICVSSVVICHVMWPLQAHIQHVSYTRTPSPYTPVKLRGSALIPFVTPRPLLDRWYLLLAVL
jgi:hypothetical protein